MPVTTNGLTTVTATSVAVSGDSTYSGNLAIGGSFVSGAANVNGSAAFAGDVWVGGNLHLVGNTVVTNVAYVTSDSLNVNNSGTGPALSIYQGGNWPVANFADQYGTALFVGNAASVTIGSSQSPTSGNVARVSGNLEITGSLFGNASAAFSGATWFGANATVVGNVILGTSNAALYAPAAQFQSKYRYAGATKTTDQLWIGTGAAPSSGGVLQYSANNPGSSPNMVIEWGNTGVLGGTLSINYRDVGYGLNSVSSFGGWTHTGGFEASSLTVDTTATVVGNLSVGGVISGNGAGLTNVPINFFQPWNGVSVGNTWANANVGIFGNVNVSQRVYSSGVNSTGTVVGSLFNTTSGSATLTTSQTTLFTVTSGSSGFLVIQPTSASLTKGLWWFEYTSSDDYCTVTQICQPAGGSYTITCTAGSNYVAASLNTGSYAFTWRVVLI